MCFEVTKKTLLLCCVDTPWKWQYPVKSALYTVRPEPSESRTLLGNMSPSEEERNGEENKREFGWNNCWSKVRNRFILNELYLPKEVGLLLLRFAIVISSIMKWNETRRTSEWEKLFPHLSHSWKRHYRRQTPAMNTLSDSIYPSDRWKAAAEGRKVGGRNISKQDWLTWGSFE